MKTYTARLKVLVPLLALGLLVAMALLPLFGGIAKAQSPRVNFLGTAITDEAAAERCSDYVISIRVDEILQDPQGELSVGQELPVYYQTAYGFSSGDVLEVFGTSYLTEGPPECADSVLVEEGAGGYIGLVVTFTGTVMGITQRMGGITWTVEVEEVLFGPPISGQVDVQWIAVPDCQGTSDPAIGVCDGVEVHGSMYADEIVDLCPSADYYIRQVRPAVRLYLPIVLLGNIAEE